MKIINVCEKIFDLKVNLLSVYSETEQYVHHHEGDGPYSLEMTLSQVTCSFSYSRENPLNPSELELLHEVLDSFFEFTEARSYVERWNCSEMLNAVLKNKSIDQVMLEMVKGLTDNNNFVKVGIFFLNETLMRLRGVMYGEKSNEFNVENLTFKSATIYLKEKNELTDVLFYDQVEMVDVGHLKTKGMERYFQGEVVACGIYSSTGPIGVIMVQGEHYHSFNFKYLSLYSKICSIAIELTRTMKQLDFAVQDINFFKESLYASDSLARIGKLAATVAHELKNPLVAIGGFAGRLRKIVDHPQGKGYLNIIVSEVQRLEDIVTDILNYSKTLSVEKVKLSLKDLLNEILEILNDKIQYNDIKCGVHIPVIDVLVDENRMKQVLINVVDNAIQSMETGGHLTLTAEEMGEQVVLSIKDTGGGIPEELLEKVFEPFFTTKDNGTGLGLPLSKKIMLAHGGDIAISNIDQGTLVTIMIPGVKK